MSQPDFIAVAATEERLAVTASGSWTAKHAGAIRQEIGPILAQPSSKQATIDITKIAELDTFGAWLLEKLARGLGRNGTVAAYAGIPLRYSGLLHQIRQTNRQPRRAEAHRNPLLEAALQAETASVSLKSSLESLVNMLGAFALATGAVLRSPRQFRLTSTVYHLDRVGWQAIPIIMLITLLIGGIIAQQGLFHFRNFGAQDYVVDLVGILVLRELGVLIVAIMVAGRSGSSYTAEIGSMKMREEIDALRTMGLDPVGVLLLPRMLALLIALPILTFIGSLTALVGGGLVLWLYGGMSPAIYISRLQEAISVTHFEVGIIKAPFMALVIAIVSCAEGLRVKGSAESLGLQTTTSVVKSIFLVIVMDGLFAMFFASIGM